MIFTDYFVAVSTKTTWSVARQHCQNLNGDLASFSSLQEQNEATSMLIDQQLQGHFYWNGLNDVQKMKKWFWSDNSSSVWRNWLNGEPNGGTKENCVVVSIDDAQWRDVGCNDLHFSVCKVPRKCISLNDISISLWIL